jgi:hypothetical protein
MEMLLIISRLFKKNHFMALESTTIELNNGNDEFL